MKMTYGTHSTFNQWMSTQPFFTTSPVDLGFPTKSISMRKPNKLHCEASLNSFSSSEPNATSSQPKWNLLQRAAAAALDAAEGAVVWLELQHRLPKFADPEIQIHGNFALVPDQPACQNLPVVGAIPECINSVYIRNGANPLFKPRAGHHVFDDDGMVHAVTINGNEVSYSCRFTETARLVQEREWGRPIFFRPIGELHGHPSLARLLLFYAHCLFGLVDIPCGTGLANAGLVYFNRRLLVMLEDDLPYHIRVKPSVDLEIVVRFNFDGNLTNSMIAHSKLDPESGELFALSYNVARKSYLKYFKVSPTGKKSSDVEIPIDVPTMTHDFAITENHVIIPDQQLVFRIQGMVSGGSLVNYDKKKKSRFDILKKTENTAEDIAWVESPDTCSLHLWNAWEDPKNQEIVVICSCMTPPDSIFSESKEDLKITLTEIRLNQATEGSRKHQIISETEQINLEVGTLNWNRVGRKTQYAYLPIAEPWPKVSGFAKVGLESAELKKYLYGEGRYGGEPFLVAREEEGDKEDEGHILSFVHDEKTWESELQIVDVVSLELQAAVKLPSRVPYGFHGTFITAKDLQTQA